MLYRWFVLRVGLVVISAGLGASACSKSTTQPAPAKAKTPVKGKAKVPGLVGAKAQRGDKGLLSAVDTILKGCVVSEWGVVRSRSCKDPKAEAHLKQREAEVGSRVALLTYCNLLGGKNHLGRALASYRIASMNYAQRMTEAADPKVFTCLLSHFGTMRKAQHVRRLARAVAFMGTALKKDALVLAAVKKQPLSVAREAAYEALWANGRGRVFPALKAAIDKAGEPALQIAAIKSFAFGTAPTPEEAKKICGVLAPHLSDADIDVAGAAAYQTASLCPEAKDALVKAAKAVLGRGAFTAIYVTALRSAAVHHRAKVTPARRKAIVGVLGEVLAKTQVEGLTRSTALMAIEAIDHGAGRRQAKAHRKDDVKFIADEAARILKRRR
ncbi:MAG: hypothetical protein KAI47_25695 [Deltaproteobacteria bacterium]|nr:hypothetical protein [Deltaproteobacteria bacterium]